MIPAAQAVTASQADWKAEAFTALLCEHKSMVYSLAWNSLQDSALAEEIAQEVFLELHKRMGRLESPDHIRNWLRKVTVNRCIDQSRRRRIRPRLGLDDVPEPSVPPPEADPLLEARLRRLVSALPEKLRMVVILRYQEDLSLEEIGEALNLSALRVKSRLHRALGLLRSKLCAASPGRQS